MAQDSQTEQLLAAIGRAYRDPATPDFHFVGRTYRRLQTHPIVLELMQRFFVKDETDLNNHVALHLHVHVPPEAIMLCLSCVAPWCMAFRVGQKEPVYSSVLSTAADFMGEEREIFRLLDQYQFRLVNKGTAAAPLRLALPDTDPEETRIYHAIVSDEGVVPQVLK